MTEEEVQQCLGDMGKTCFVRYFPLFVCVQNHLLSRAYAVHILHQSEGYTQPSCNTRVSEALAIITGGAVHSACHQVEASEALPEWVRDGARLIRESWQELPH